MKGLILGALASFALASCSSPVVVVTVETEAPTAVQRQLADTINGVAYCDRDLASPHPCRILIAHLDGPVVRIGGHADDGRPMVTTDDRNWVVYDTWFRERFGHGEYDRQILVIAGPGIITDGNGRQYPYADLERAYREGRPWRPE